DMLYNLCYLTIILIIVGSRHAGRTAATARQPVRGPRRSDETRHHRSTTCPRRTERWRGRGSRFPLHTSAAPAGSTQTRHHRSTTCPRRTERWRGRGSLFHQHTCHHPALAGAGGGRIDRAPDRATVALCTRACERAGADGKLARTAAAALVGGTRPVWNKGGRSQSP